jgi:hypothetical protein
MLLLRLILTLATLNNIQSFGSISNPDPSTSIDSLQIIEKVYLHADRDYYYPGDDIWFKAYLIDAADRSLSVQSRSLHVELISPSSKIIMSRIIRLEAGLGNGDFKLPDNLISGKYKIRAYTNYMRNFGDQLFFKKDITVINPSDSINAISDSVNYKKNKIEISFFPEGGSLVDNVSSVVAFKAVNVMGKGCDISGEIYSSAGELIKTFKSSHIGMGSFLLRPLPGLSYYSIVKDTAGNEIRSELPKSFPFGVTLSASTNDNDELLVTVCTNNETLPEMLDKALFLTFSARKVPLKTISFKIKTYNNSFVLPTEDLPDGIVMMTLSTLEDVPLAERLIYIQRDQDFKITVEAGKPVYKQRDSVIIRISSSSEYDLSQEAFLSLSAVEGSFTDNSSQYATTISSWFLLESDIRGPVENPSYYFDPSDPERLHYLDLLLLTQGWRDFQWKYDNTNYYPVEFGFTVSASLRKLNVNKPLADSRVNIGIFDRKGSLITTTETDSSGRFHLDDIDLTGEATLVVTAANEKGKLQNCVVLLDSSKYVPAVVTDNFFTNILLQEKSITTYKQEYEIKEAIRKKYRLTDTISLGEVSIIARKKIDFQTQKVENIRMIYNKPDNEVIVTAKYSGYKNVFEVLKGRTSGVIVTGDGPYRIRIRGSNSYSIRNNPLILIDGLDVSSGRLDPYEALNTLPLSYVDRIDVLKSAGETGAYGVRGANGVISIITKTGDAIPLSKPANHSLTTKMSGYNEARIFYSPQHSSSPVTDIEPDLRTTIFWEPDIRLGSDKSLSVNFFNADNSAKIKVTVEGITTTGIPITAGTEYEIR